MRILSRSCLSPARISWQFLDTATLIDEYGQHWGAPCYSASWMAHVVKSGARRQIYGDAMETTQGAGSTRTGQCGWKAISETLHAKRLIRHEMVAAGRSGWRS